jgi:cell division protein FtsL
MHGSLAVREQQREQQRVTTRETRRVVSRTKSLPAGEKLLLLFLVAVFVFVAGIVCWRYTQLYNINNRVAQIQASIHEMETENSLLKQQVDKLSDPRTLEMTALELGYVPVADAKSAVTLTTKAQANTAQASTAQGNATLAKVKNSKPDQTKQSQVKADPKTTVIAQAKVNDSAATAKR